MGKLKFCKDEIKFHLGLNVLIAIFITIASYVHYPYGGLKAFLIYLIHFFLLQFSLFGFIYIFSLFSKVFKIVFPILFIILASFSFWVYTQDFTIGIGMIQGIFGTNIGEATDALNLPFILFVLIAFFSVLCFFRLFKKLRKSSIKSPLFFIAILGVSIFFIVENYKYGAFKRRLPYNVYYSVLGYFSKPNLKLIEPKENIVTKEEKIQIIFVLGESVRADHLSLNGYDRNTTPLLSKQKNLISFKTLYTPFTFTAQSLPQILTDKSIEDNKENEEYNSLYTLLKKASFKTEWIGNQFLEKSYRSIIHTNESITIIDEFHSVLSFKKEKDLALLNYFSLNETYTGNSISTLHMIGSHWYYNSRVDDDFKYFTPVTSSKYLGSSTKEEMINSYDNTIVYLDIFLDKLIEKLKTSSKKTILIYLSDHGETLGEDEKWLHAQGNKASKNPAMLVWYSDNFEKSYPSKIDKLKSKKQDSITTDFLFHSILDIGNIENFKYKKEQSIFN